MVATLLSLLGCGSSQVTQWEHGWKTKRVIATRYSSGAIGYNVGFKFPLDPNNGDRAEISDFIESKGGSIFESGGYAGAESFATFEGVTDKATADAKLKQILPELDKLMADMADGKKIPPFKAQEPPLTMAQWIEKMNAKRRPCKGDGWQGSGTNGYDSWTTRCVNGVEVYEDTGEETQKRQAEYQAHKDKLARDLTTRILTQDEMKEVAAYGSSLLTRNMVPYQADDVERRFQTMLMIQQTLRAGRVSETPATPAEHGAESSHSGKQNAADKSGLLPTQLPKEK